MTLGELLDTLNGIHGALPNAEDITVVVGPMFDTPTVEVIERQGEYIVVIEP